MIGVIANKSQAAIVEEFFQLFKTPWEFYREGCSYDVVISTSEASGIDASLVIVYDPARSNPAPKSQPGSSVTLTYRGMQVPLYGEARIVPVASTAHAICRTGQSEVIGIRETAPGREVLRLGYNLFDEVAFLLTQGQPVEHAQIPTLDLHIAMLREWIVEAGIELIEIPPVPAGRDFIVCLTHDIDFIGIRQHFFDHTMFGFLYRSTMGAVRDVLRKRISLSRLFQMWTAALSLPLIYLGWKRDFWVPFDWYLRVEKGLPATYYLIPFKRRPGQRVPGRHAARRATAYDISDLTDWAPVLREQQCELGVHGIDSWHDAQKGREELDRLRAIGGGKGIRMHWLMQDSHTPRVLEEAGYEYDSTNGYNETPGYRSGTAQVFRPAGVEKLLELPMLIQDGALFYQKRADMSESEAWTRCHEMIQTALAQGGVLTVLWHDRSHGPERFWGEFYERLVGHLRSLNAWFATAAQAVSWFQRRRDVVFEISESAGRRQVARISATVSAGPGLIVRFNRRDGVSQQPWSGEKVFAFPTPQGCLTAHA